jgi:hypothetical protein
MQQVDNAYWFLNSVNGTVCVAGDGDVDEVMLV